MCGEVPHMNVNNRTRRTIAITEISALLLGAIALLSSGTDGSATAAPSAPFHIATQTQLTGITVNSPWVKDWAGTATWGIGSNQSGGGVLVRRDSVSGEWTSSTLEPDEIAATAGTAVVGSTQIAFVVSPSGGGARHVVIDTITRTRVSSGSLPAAALGTRGMGSSSQGYVFALTPGNPASLIKIATATSVIASTLTLPATSSPASTIYTKSGTMYLTTKTSPVKLVAVKNNPGTAIEFTSTLVATVPILNSGLYAGDTGWYGTTTTPGRVVGISTSSKSATADFSGPPNSVGVNNLTLDKTETTAWYTTAIGAKPFLVNMRLSDGVVLSSTALDGTLSPSGIHISDHFVDVVGTGIVSVARYGIIAPPTQPRDITTIIAPGRLEISWTPDTSSEAPVSYTVTARANDGEFSCTTTSFRCGIDGLTDGRDYTMTVHATSAVGSTQSAPVTVRPARLPDAPVNLATVRGDGVIDTTWTPGFDGGRPISRFVAIAEPGNHRCESTSTRCQITGLTNGKAYAVTVYAETSIGKSAETHASHQTIPATVPARPEILFTRIEGRKQIIKLCAPTETGGYPVSSLRAAIVKDGVVASTHKASGQSLSVSNRNLRIPMAVQITATSAIGESAPTTIAVQPLIQQTLRSSARNSHEQQGCGRRHSATIEIKP